MIAHVGWLQRLQYGAYRIPRVGIAGPKLLYPDGTIQSAGTIRNPGAPEWFDHAHRFKPAEHPPADVPQPYLAMTGAAMYIKRRVLDEVGLFDEGYGMAYEDVDLCLRAWEAGERVLYFPPASLTHLESKTRGMVQRERELESQRRFWRAWRPWFDDRNVRAPDGGLRIVYVSEDTGVGGGHRVVFHHLNGLAARGHHAELWTLGDRPDWFELDVPVRTLRRPTTSSSRRSIPSRRSRSRRGGTPRRPSGWPRCAAACPSTWCRTSRRPTTPTTPSPTPTCSPRTGPSSGSSPGRSGSPSG